MKEITDVVTGHWAQWKPYKMTEFLESQSELGWLDKKLRLKLSCGNENDSMYV